MALGLSNGDAFLHSANRIHLFTAPLNIENTDFQLLASLIVPTFYMSAQERNDNTKKYHWIGDPTTVTINEHIEVDDVVSLSGKQNSFIPLQNIYKNKIELQFDASLKYAENYAITHQNDTLGHISFNQRRKESKIDVL